MRLLPVLVLLITLVLPAGLRAAPGPAATSPAEADADFPFVGEYLGTVHALEGGRWTATPIGLQVTGLGGGQFEAVEYYGGLPGAGWNGRLKAVLPGHRDGGTVQIDALPVGIQLNGYTGHVGTARQAPAYGTLRRINRASPTLGLRPPAQATVLFDGRGTGQFEKATLSPEGLLTQGALTKDAWSDFTLHLEFRLPYMPAARDQGRANSGVYLQQRYEIQILEWFGFDPVFNSSAAVYRTKPADLNMSFPPLTWQTYDIRFQAAQFDAGRKVADARVTVWHNGVKVQDNFAIPTKTGAGKPEGPQPLPILLQDHGNPVRFRNIWILDNAQYPQIDATPHVVR